ncbi:hypothetical protein [Catellatospora citrea]|uniref:Uncharacterized protein n=1 Tax=Catellatospora citrea TaxID=53366 RepID=A0A8J3P0N2_9ACTN|nr:hypothetical protein [Catellatospora citrea]RKE10465.1 hypothetical protein C8E86_5368 [Catellatospora citrea]GIF99026.1 hypothetical protein Cci01nite_41200 [Catellatospora citrea]
MTGQPRSVWRGTADGSRTAMMMLVAAGASFGAAAVLISAVGPRVAVLAAAYVVTGAVLVLYAALVLVLRALTSWRVVTRIDSQALRVASWPLPWYRTTVAVDAVHAVQTVEAGPSRHDVLWWLLAPRDGRYVVRHGPALRLVLASGCTMTVSVDGADEALAAFGEPKAHTTTGRT